MHRRKFLERMGIGVIAVAVIPQLSLQSDVPAQAISKSEKAPFVKYGCYYSPTERKSYFAVSEEELIIITDNWTMSSNSRDYPDDLKMIYSAAYNIIQL